MTKLLGALFAPHPPIIVPEVGGGREREAAPTLAGFERLNEIAARLNPDAVIVLTTHGPMFSDAMAVVCYDVFEGGLEQFGYAHKRRWPLARELGDAVLSEAARAGVSVVQMDEGNARKYRQQLTLDHAAAVPLLMLPALFETPIVCIAPGFLPRKTLFRAGQALRAAADKGGGRVLILASGDLAHNHQGGPYNFSPDAVVFDALVRDAIATGDSKALMDIDERVVESAGQCGLNSFLAAFGALDGLECGFEVYSCEAPFGIGYLTGSALPTGATSAPLFEEYPSRESSDPYVAFARDCVEHYVLTHRQLDYDRYRDRLEPVFRAELESRAAGAFVSLHKDGELRGCIGTILPTAPSLAEEIIYCAAQAAGHDPRFSPVARQELQYLDIKVDILGKIEDIVSEAELDVRRYGVIVHSGHRRGLLLPDLEGVDSVAQQVDIARRKAGISPGEQIKLQRFEVIRHE